MDAALFFLSRGRKVLTIAFEPGEASDLLDANVRLNGLASQVRTERMAVGERTGPAIFFSEPGHSENNRLVNPEPYSDSHLVECVRLDEYLAEQQVGDHLLIKIDTQGAEYSVLCGMGLTLRERLVSMVIEFTPDAVYSRIHPFTFLEELGAGRYIFDLGPYHDRMQLVAPGGYEDLTARVQASTDHWTDLLVLPRDLPGVSDLLSLLSPSTAMS
jgi:FkbM family methyltransferase